MTGDVAPVPAGWEVVLGNVSVVMGEIIIIGGIDFECWIFLFLWMANAEYNLSK